MSHKATPLLLAIICCGGDSKTPPVGSTSGDGSDGSNGSSNTVDCDDEWTTEEDGTHVQPESCLRWSQRSPTQMTWYEAASEADGLAGNCGSDCPDPGDGYCANLGDPWRLPTIDELKDAAKTYPEIEDGDGWLWSRDTSSFISENAMTGNLERAGVSMQSDKASTEEWVRCVSEG